MTLEGFHLETISIDLIKPYVLSFTTVRSIDSIRLTLQIKGKTYTAEVVPLVGYNDESTEVIENHLHATLPPFIGKSISEIRAEIQQQIRNNFSFRLSPILVAIDLYLIDQENESFDLSAKEMDFVVPLSLKDIQEGLNPTTDYKLKLSANIEDNLNALRFIQENYPEIKFRTDANQAFDLDSCSQFFETIQQEGLASTFHYVEQPTPSEDWETIGKIKKRYPQIPIMLDESVVNTSDLNKAVDLGIEFVKLKLFKQGGIKETLDLAKLAHTNGMKVVIGNGVASKVSNDVENWIYQKNQNLFFQASEGNGFLKLKRV